MKSLKRFKNQLVRTRELSARTADTSPTVKKIRDINDSAYKLDAKPTTRGTKTDHSLGRKSPIQIPERYLTTHRQMTFRQPQRRARPDYCVPKEEELFANVAIGYNSYSARSNCQLRQQQPNPPRPFDCATDLLKEHHNLQLSPEQLECIRDIWRAIQKLRGRKEFSIYMDQIRRVLNEICRRGMKPEFSDWQQGCNSTQKVIRIPSLSSNLLEQSPSPENQRETPIDSMTNSPQLRDTSYESENEQAFRIPPQQRHNSNLEYRKILYMLERQSQSNILGNPVQSKFSEDSFLESSVNRQHSRLTSCSQGSERDKRVVLREIVDMLNTKYHRNIKL